MNDHPEYRRKSDVSRERFDGELRQAQMEVEQQRNHVEYALSQLEGKMQDTFDDVTQFFFKSGKPIRLARENPLISASIFVIAGFALGAWLTRKIDSSSSTQLVGAEALENEGLGLKTERDLGLGLPKSDRIETL